MQFRVLGPFEATDGRTPLKLGGPKPRALPRGGAGTLDDLPVQ